jgi:hypothetical protein
LHLQSRFLSHNSPVFYQPVCPHPNVNIVIGSCYRPEVNENIIVDRICTSINNIKIVKLFERLIQDAIITHITRLVTFFQLEDPPGKTTF